MNSTKEIRDLEEENERLKQENKLLKEEKDKILEEKDKILEQKKQLEKEFEEFKAKHTITVENLQKALKIKPDKKTTGKSVGAQDGHKGYSRHIPERIDFIKPLIPFRCPDCNSKLEGETQDIRERYVTDIELISKTHTTKFEIHRKYCKNCKKLVESPVPNTLPRAKYGLNIMLLVMYLHTGLRMPGNKVSEYFMNLYSLKIGEGEIAMILTQLKRAYQGYYDMLENIMRTARIKHTDSTSWRINGKSYYAWVFVTAGVVLYKICKRNNANAPLKVFGRTQKGMILVVDRFSACLALAKKAGFLLQLCWSHILQDSKELARGFGKEGKFVHKELKRIFAMAKDLDHKGKQEHVEQLQAEIFMLTQKKYKSSTIRKFVHNLYFRDRENLFRFVTNPDVDPTNNISERELRALVLIRKISNGSRSIKGAEITQTLLSVIQTMRMKKENILLGLQQILAKPSFH